MTGDFPQVSMRIREVIEVEDPMRCFVDDALDVRGPTRRRLSS